MIRSTLALAVLAALSFSAHAVVQFDQNVTPANAELITGTGGILNGGFTTDQRNNFEIGLRARERYDLATDSPSNVTGSNGDGSYVQNAGSPAAFPLRARWNFDFSINSDLANVSGVGARNLSGFTYSLGLDTDATVGTTFVTFDPINVACADHSFGNNTTGNSAGTEAGACPGAAAAYLALVANNNAVQQSWNYGFFPLTAGLGDDPGIYTIFLQVSDSSGVLARSEINVCVGGVACVAPTLVPEPASLALLGLGLAGLGFSRRRKIA